MGPLNIPVYDLREGENPPTNGWYRIKPHGTVYWFQAYTAKEAALRMDIKSHPAVKGDADDV